MGIDLDELRKKYLESSNTDENGDFLSKFLNIQEGTNLVRILPDKEERPFYAETKIHRVPHGDNGVKNFHCRKVHGEKCPLCDAYYGLWDMVNKGNLSPDAKKKAEALARQIKPRDRFYMNVVDRETGDVKILSIGIILFKKIVSMMVDPDYGDITDLATGHDFKIVKEMDGQWPKYDQSAARPKSTEAGSKADISGWMESLHDIHGLVKLEEFDDVKAAAEELLPSSTNESSLRQPESKEVDDDDYLAKMRLDS